MQDWFTPAPAEVFFRSTKSGDIRLGEISQPREKWDQKEKGPTTYCLAGYPDDEGIQLNLGRLGARQAPDQIRTSFYKTTPGTFFKTETQIVDFGNLQTSVPLEQRHQRVQDSVREALGEGCRWIGLGGGHDYGYPDGSGFLIANKDSRAKPLVINFDAHLDVRPSDRGLSSGTPFYRLLTDDSLPEFDFYEIGIQGQCNSQSHMDWAREKGAKIITFEEIMSSGQSQYAYLSQRLGPELLPRRPTYISIDIDGFSSSYAMGCSQSWPTGFVPNELFPFLNFLYNLADVQVLGIYEVSPPLDLDNRTVKLASQLIHQYISPLR